MKISKLKLAWHYLTKGIGGVADYLLEMLNAALASIDPANKAKVQSCLNVATAVLSTLIALQWLCPVKWQTSYKETVEAVAEVVGALEDLNITAEELARVQKEFNEAVAAWQGPDDETCVA